MTNARAETVLDKAGFAKAAVARRCLVPAAGWYEWQVSPVAKDAKGKPRKQPFYIHRGDGAPIAFAGLYDAVLQGQFMYAMEYFPLGSLGSPARELSRDEKLAAIADAARGVDAARAGQPDPVGGDLSQGGRAACAGRLPRAGDGLSAGGQDAAARQPLRGASDGA